MDIGTLNRESSNSVFHKITAEISSGTIEGGSSMIGFSIGFPALSRSLLVR